jgi:ATP-dependent Lhr-like helicase
MDLVYGAVTADLVRRRDIEACAPIAGPLDILAQVILGLAGIQEWKLDGLFDFLLRMEPYHGLRRGFFDLTVDMLAGRYAALPVRELKPRVDVDVLAGTIRTRPGGEFLLYQSGGTIPDRGLYQLRHAGDKALLGELDEEFVWERNLGDQFVMGTAAWRIMAITQNAVEVLPADPARFMVPFWKAEDQNRDFHSAEAAGLFLEALDPRLDDPELPAWLEAEYGLDPTGAENLVRFLLSQRSLSGCPLPSRRHLVIEEIGLGADAKDRHGAVASQLIVHTFWGGRVNKPFALALAAAWEERFGAALEFFAGNESIMLQLPGSAADGLDLVALVTSLVDSRRVEELLRRRLEGSGLFGARFRENAARALLLPRGDARRRIPLWITRMRSRKLLDAVSAGGDFPLVVETWRDCLEDEFDLENLRRLLDELASGDIRVSHRKGREPSPFAADMVWRQTNRDLYQDDTPAPGGASSLSSEIFRTLLGEARLRPPVPSELASKFTAKLQSTWPDYRPGTPGELIGVLSEHGFMAATLWDELCHFSSFGIASDPGFMADLSRLSSLFVRFRPRNAQVDWISAVPQLPAVLPGLGYGLEDPPAELPTEVKDWLRGLPRPETGAGGDVYNDADAAVSRRARLLLRWLERQGPVSSARIEWMFGWTADEVLSVVEQLALDGKVVTGALIEGNEGLRVCESENYERLLRLHRNVRRLGFESLPLAELPLFLADWHGLAAPVPDPGLATLQDVLDRCMGCPLPAALWEQAVLPTRLRPYQPAWLDTLVSQYGVCWIGAGEGRLVLAFRDETSLYHDEPAAGGLDADTGRAALLECLAAAGSGRSVLELARDTGLEAGRTGELLWKLAWEGRVTADSFEAVRQGLRSDFKGDAPAPGRVGRRRWEHARPGGSWLALRQATGETDAVDRLEASRERVGQLLRRYGIVFRELLAGELPALQWSRVQKTLRLMELSGEVLAGRFFEGIPGIQFASPEAVRRLHGRSMGEGDGDGAVWWINAQDPISLCGLGLDPAAPGGGLGPEAGSPSTPGLELPRRVASTWLVYAANRLVMVARRQGKELDLALEPGDGQLPRVLAFFPFLLTRSLDAAPAVMVEAINGLAVAQSPYAPDFRRVGFIADHHGLTLWRRY